MAAEVKIGVHLFVGYAHILVQVIVMGLAQVLVPGLKHSGMKIVIRTHDGAGSAVFLIWLLVVFGVPGFGVVCHSVACPHIFR